MKNILINYLAIITAFTLFLSYSADAHSRDKFELERKGQAISAALVDGGDYYIHPNGQKVKFLRKKDVFALEGAQSQPLRAKGVGTMSKLKAQLGDRVELLENHRLGSSMVVRLNNKVVPNRLKAKALQYNIEPSMLKSLDLSISSIQPVLASEQGQGDILVTSKLLLKLNRTSNVDADLSALAKDFNLRVNRRLNVAGAVFHLDSADSVNATTSKRFEFVRRVMNHGLVEWAQPLFKSKPTKAAFQPADPLYERQWHLRNIGEGGSRCDTDCDADLAWDVGGAQGFGGVSGAGTVIAIIDDGVDLEHQDLAIWTNENEMGPDGLGGDKETNGIDDDGNGCIDDVHGCDFVDDSQPNPALLDANGESACLDNDGVNIDRSGLTILFDGDPSPQAMSSCVLENGGGSVQQDNHGTAVAGIAAAKSSVSEGGGTGVVGVAFSAEVLPIRLISDFDGDPEGDFCARAAEAMTYAGRYADVINGSWAIERGTCALLDTVIADVVDGSLLGDEGIISHRPELGSPVVFASGNNASGWVKVTTTVSAGQHAYEWRFRRTNADILDVDLNVLNIDDEVRIDNITWSDNSLQGFENFDTDIAGFTNACELNVCDGNCSEIDLDCALWKENIAPEFVFEGRSSLSVNILNANCSYSYLHTSKDGPAGDVSFWVWVSTITDVDKFEFLVDGEEVVSFGDIAEFGFVDNAVSYPASLAETIAVGASTSGDLSGITTIDSSAEQRAPYSQYGGNLDIVAPSSDQHLAITTTDRSGGAGFSDDDVTSSFEGTSASAALVSGVAAAVIAFSGENDAILNAFQVRELLQDSADNIGSLEYNEFGRNLFFGHGRVNMFRALSSLSGEGSNKFLGSEDCVDPAASFSYMPPGNDLLLSRYFPSSSSIDSCPALGPDDDGDSVDDEVDNCPRNANTDQADLDEDGLGDVCDIDADNDGALADFDTNDLNPFVCSDDDLDGCDDCSLGAFNISNDGADTDSNGQCNVGDVDDDGDTIGDSIDNCPLNINADQADLDQDGVGDVCDDNNNVDVDQAEDDPLCFPIVTGNDKAAVVCL